MKKRKAAKILLIIAGILIAIQLPWFLVIQTIVNKTQIKTKATVIRIDKKETVCTGDRAGRLDRTCDHSDIVFPVYEFFGPDGTRYEKSDEYLGEYKENNPLWKIFGREIGETATVYYEASKPETAVFMTGLPAYTAWLIPLYLSFPVLISSGVLFLISRFQIKK